MDELEADVADFLAMHPTATVADVMAEFDISDTEVAAILRSIRARAEDEKDMARIKREWDAYDRDPPGS